MTSDWGNAPEYCHDPAMQCNIPRGPDTPPLGLIGSERCRSQASFSRRTAQYKCARRRSPQRHQFYRLSLPLAGFTTYPCGSATW